MAEVFDTVHGQPIERVIARTREARDGVRDEVEERKRVAEAILASHRHDGHSKITLEKAGPFDFLLTLDDDRGQGAAMTIEFGREGGNLDVNGNPVAPMDPVAPIRKAVNIPPTKRKR